MSDGGRSIRAFRPSRLALDTEYDDQEIVLVKQRNLQLYVERARAGLPLFEAVSPVSRLNVSKR